MLKKRKNRFKNMFEIGRERERENYIMLLQCSMFFVAVIVGE